MLGRLFRRKAKAKAARPPGKAWWRRAFSTDRLMGLALLAGCMSLYWADPYPVEFARLKMFDSFQQLKPRQIPEPARKPVTIIDLDERSLAEYGQWPWSRVLVAQMTENLRQMGAVLVAFDIVFAEPDRLNPSGIAKTLTGLDEETQKKLTALPSNDAVLAEAIRRGRVVLGQTGIAENRGLPPVPPVRKSVALRAMVQGVAEPKHLVYRFPDLVRNVPEIEKVAAGHGVFTIVPEGDGIVRRVQMLFNYNDDLYPSLSLEMLRVAFNRPTLLVNYNQGGIQNIPVASRAQVPPDGLTIVTDSSGQVYPYFSKQDRAKYVSAADVLKGTANPALIKGKMAIVGTSAAGLLDIRAVPTEPILPGVEVHAQLIEASLTGEFLTRPNTGVAIELAFILVGGLLMIVLVPWVGAKWTLLVVATVATGAIGTSWYQFAEYRTLYDAGFATASILLLYMFLTYTSYAKEEAQRQRVRSAFSHYLSPAMVETLANDPTKLKLGGEAREMSMLFCDVRGFTTISEMYDAEGLTKLINKLLTPLTKVILDRNGTVDKYMGDCIMAFWNAPLDDEQHARNCCISALEMVAVMGPLNERLAAEAAQEGRKLIPLKVGVGLNSGRVVVGNMGSDMRFDYSILGDSVNLASRLEGQCKTYYVDTVIGENTQKLAPEFAALELDLIRVKGKAEAVRIFTLLGDETVKAGNAFTVLSGTHGEMLAAYRAQNWTAAKDKIAACRQLLNGFNLVEYYDVYAERIAEFEANPPSKDWDGVYVATSK